MVLSLFYCIIIVREWVVYILSGKKLQQLPRKVVLNRNDFTYIVGNFLGYLGPSLLQAMILIKMVMMIFW